MLKRNTTWEFMTKFVRAVFPMLVVLRLADRKDPVMDKLYFYVRRMDKTLMQSKIILDDIEERTRGVYWHVINDITEDDNSQDESCYEYASDETVSSIDDDGNENGTKISRSLAVSTHWYTL